MSDSEGEIDIQSLLLPSIKRKKKDVKGKAVAIDSDDDDDDDDAFASLLPELTRSQNAAASTALIKGLKKSVKGSQATKGLLGGGSFQSLGLPPALLKALLQRGFSTPTPIQRHALPSILGELSTVELDKGRKVTVARDHLCMARTGSGKTLCYLIPLLARLTEHSTTFGARALILVPTRELALQVLKVGKDLARGAHKGGDALRWAMIVGGESMEEQFELLSGNPDVIIATPGRLLHLVIEMSLSLARIQYFVLDEADRLFSLGFAEQLHELVHRLSSAQRQTLLFSATLPTSLVGFAKIGLQNPRLIRLDSESKISSELKMAFLSVKETEKEAVLLGLLREVLHIPYVTRAEEEAKAQKDREEIARELARDYSNVGRHGGGGGAGSKQDRGKKRKRGAEQGGEDTTAQGEKRTQALVFVATKHHVEYLNTLLTSAGYSVSPIYGSMDQTARKISLATFRRGETSLLVVTDLAARGIDIPGVEAVINYDFPNGAKNFVHRVGRTARAGRKGWAYTLLNAAELPHMLDLELFLGRKIKTCPLSDDGTKELDEIDTSARLVLGTAPRSLTDLELDNLRTLHRIFPALEGLQSIARRGRRLYERGLSKASAESFRRSKELERRAQGLASVPGGEEGGNNHPIYESWIVGHSGQGGSGTVASARADEDARLELMSKINAFKPSETIFEVGVRGSKTPGAQLMKDRRKALEIAVAARVLRERNEDDDLEMLAPEGEDEDARNEVELEELEDAAGESEAGEEELEAVFGLRKKKKKARGDLEMNAFRDKRFYLDYEQEGAGDERGYSLADGESFAMQAASAVDEATLGDTEGIPMEARMQKASALRWDRKTKKFVKGDGVGADNKKMVKSESGRKLPASFKSGIFDEWRKRARVSVPRVGDAEIKGRTVGSGKKYRHKAGTPSDQMQSSSSGGPKKKGKKGLGTRTVGGTGKPGSAPGGLKTATEIRKDRIQKAHRVRRSNMPGKGAKGGAGGGSPKKK